MEIIQWVHLLVGVPLVSSPRRLFQVRVCFVYNVNRHYYITMDNAQVVTGPLYLVRYCHIILHWFYLLINYFLLRSVDILPMDQSSSGQRTCVSCPIGTWADSSKSLCVPCGVSDCSICTGSKVVGEVCFTSDLSLPPSQPFSFYTEFYSFALELCNVCYVMVLLYYSPVPIPCIEWKWDCLSVITQSLCTPVLW